MTVDLSIIFCQMLMFEKLSQCFDGGWNANMMLGTKVCF
jgi:hypothetical protein